MKVAIVHYHLQPGGVTRVIENTMRAWEQNDTGPDQCVVLTGRPYPGNTLQQVQVVEGLDYAEAKDAISSTSLKQRLEQGARDALGALPDIWHIHNHSLGKNPALTGAVAELASAGASILLQPHDFAEDGRANNFSNLSSSKERAYPTAPQIHYAALNQRDQSFLQKSLEGSLSPVHLLANAIPENQPNLACSSGGKFPDLPENLFLYPVRAVRRKNLGELALLSTAYPEFHFANSLGPTNPSFLPVYKSWIDFASRQGLQLTYGIGEQTEASFPELVGLAHSLVNVSVAEGFGLGFLEPWTFGKSLCGRNLPEITADFTELGLNLDHLYNEIYVDSSLIDKQELEQATAIALKKVYSQYGRNLPDNGIIQAYNSICTAEGVKFGYLNEDLQKSVIEKAKGSELTIAEIRKQTSLHLLNDDQIEKNKYAVKENFSLQMYGKKVFGIYQQITQANPETVQFTGCEPMLDRFLCPERLNLLRV